MEVLKYIDKMKILITHVYSNHNKGDAALLSVLIEDVKRGFNNPDITVLTLDSILPEEKFDGEKMSNSFMYYARDKYSNIVLKMLYASYVLVYTLVWAVLYRLFSYDLNLNDDIHDVILKYKNADLIIPVGGGYIRSQPGFNGTFVLVFILHPIIFASIIKKITIGYSQSVGPFGNRFQEFIARYAVMKMSAIIVREKISESILNKWGIFKNVFLSVDSGFMFKPQIDFGLKQKLGIPEDKKIVGVTVRSWLNDSKQEKYEKDIAFLCDYIINKNNCFVVFIPQVTVENHNDDDRVSSRRVISYISNKSSVLMLNDKFDHNVIKSIYGSLDFLIGTRFHSVIFALTSMVPSIAIQYEHKTRGIMRDLDLEKWVIDIDKTDKDELVKMFDDLFVNRSDYLNHLKKQLPSYIEKARGTVEILKDVYKYNRT